MKKAADPVKGGGFSMSGPGGPVSLGSKLRHGPLLACRRQVGAAAVGGFGAQADAFAQRGVRVDGLADVDLVGAHLDGQGHLPIMSPACVPTMPPPRMRWVSASNSSLVKPSSRPLVIARPEALQGNRPFLTLMPWALAWSSVRPTQATSGSV